MAQVQEMDQMKGEETTAAPEPAREQYTESRAQLENALQTIQMEGQETSVPASS
jgi:hypothetical protein